MITDSSISSCFLRLKIGACNLTLLNVQQWFNSFFYFVFEFFKKRGERGDAIHVWSRNVRPIRSNGMVMDEEESLSKSNFLHSLMKETMNVWMNESVNKWMYHCKVRWMIGWMNICIKRENIPKTVCTSDKPVHPLWSKINFEWF